ncbi:MAG: sodium-dependent transporter [Brotaphodocola sp.]
MEKQHKRSNFSGTIGFVLAAAGSSVGLGNIWRFPYLAAKDGGGAFLLIYVILALTFGFTLLTTEIAIGRKTAQSPLTAYGKICEKFHWIGVLACIVPVVILPYYCTIGGWVLKYFFDYMTGNGAAMVADGYFTSFITDLWSPVIWFLVFLLFTMAIVYRGVNQGIEKYSKVLMPLLFVLIVAIALFSLTLKHTDADGAIRTGMEGFLIYAVPDFSGMTLQRFLIILTDAMGQLFYSISVAMGIMITYGSYVKKNANLGRAVNQIEFFDTLVAFLAGMMIVPAVYTFMGTEGMSAGPGLMFVSLPKVFAAMGSLGPVVGVVFFLMVFFAAVTSSVSIMEAVVSSMMDKFHTKRKKSVLMVTAYTLASGVIVCLGYNLLYFEVVLPNGSVGQILDVLDYFSNSFLMPIVSIATCILIGWIVKPGVVIDEVTAGGNKFGRKGMYVLMIRFIAPFLLMILFLQGIGAIRF